MPVCSPKLPPPSQMRAVFLSFSLKLLGGVAACGSDAVAVPSPTERGGQCPYAWAGSQVSLHTRHRVSPGAAEVWGLWESWFLTLEMSEFSLLFLISDLLSEALTLTGQR